MRTKTVYVVAHDEDDAEIGIVNRTVKAHDYVSGAERELWTQRRPDPDMEMQVLAVEMTLVGRKCRRDE